MWYNTYASCKYAKISISIYVGNITLNIYSRITYVSIWSLSNGTQLESLVNIYIVLFILFWSISLGDPRPSPNAFILFFLNFSLHFSLIGTERMWNRTPTTWFPFILFSLIYLHLGREGVGSNPHNPTLIFLLTFSLVLPRGRGFDSHTPQPFIFIFIFIPP